MAEKKWTAHKVKAAIAKRHKEDLFFTEVKDGPTQIVNHHSKIDALSMKISWTKFTITGYEVKVSRSDFLRDEKWHAYLPMCNQLYFAVAPGVCDTSEVPEVCGLVTVTQNGGLRTVRKAPWREIDPPVEMFMYLMFNYIGAYGRRDAALPRAEQLLREDRLDLFRKYLADKAEMKEIGRRVGGKLNQEIGDLQRQIDRMKMAYDVGKTAEKDVTAICRALGVTTYYQKGQKCLEAIDQMKKSGGITPDMVHTIRNLHALADNLEKAVEGGDSA